jgi:hypothetical protein
VSMLKQANFDVVRTLVIEGVCLRFR